MNLTLTDDLQRLLRSEVEKGQFPDEEAVVREAVRLFLTSGTQGHPPTGTLPQPQDQRTPGPFLADEMVLPPVTLPRPDADDACSCLEDAARWPDRFPGE
jgi:hypothetical protein